MSTNNNDEFSKEKEYVFIGKIANLHPVNIEKNIFGHYILGKFVNFKDIPLHGDIIPNAKAVFEFGTIDCGQFHNVVDQELAYKKNV
jgi:hypothetical protein